MKNSNGAVNSCSSAPSARLIAELIEERTRMNSNVTHPAHYNSGRIEVIEAIEDWKLGYHLGNAMKYIARAGRKDPAKFEEDLQKAVWYIQRQIELIRAPDEMRSPVKPNDMNPVRYYQPKYRDGKEVRE
jgi:Protein of unknwon function (DUF3310)